VTTQPAQHQQFARQVIGDLVHAALLLGMLCFQPLQIASQGFAFDDGMSIPER